MTTDALLALTGVTRRFGGLTAVSDLTMTVAPGAVHGLIGPNGAGKSTAFDLISGLTAVNGGSIVFDGRDVTNLPVEQRVAAGICRTFQTSRLFEAMTVLDTVMTGVHLHARTGFLSSVFSFRGKSRDEADTLSQAWELLDLVGLQAEARTLVSELSYGPRRLVEIARALATRPKLLLLDEVASGLNPVETAFVSDLITTLRARGVTIVLVEHDMRFIMGLCDRVTVLNFGACIADDAPSGIVRNEAVIEAYLGRPRSDATARRELRRAVASSQSGRRQERVQ